MNKYELLTIFSATLSDEAKEKIVAKYSQLVEADGGKVLNVNKWGIKKFAYPIDYKKEGYYVLYEFEANAETPAKINNLMNIDEAVLRSLCLRKNEEKSK